MNRGLFSSAIWGVQWSSISTVATTVMQVLYTSVMARLLEPEIFGIMAIAQILLHFASYFSRLGMGRALVQREGIIEQDVRAVFTSSVLLGVVFCGIIWGFAPLVGDFFKESDELLVSVIQIMSLSFLISGFSLTSQSLLIRDCQFKLLSKIEIGSFVIFLIVGITLGMLGFGVWSLVFASLSQSFVSSVFIFLKAPHRVVPLFSWKYHQPFYSYGAVFSITSIVDFMGQNVVPVLIGRFYGDYKLGIFRQANNIMHLPLAKISISINNVFFPLMSKIQNDKEKLKNSYLTALETVSNLLFPICLVISAVSAEVVLVLLGDKFVESGPILAILCIGLAFEFLIPYSASVLDATAKLTQKFYAQLIYVIVLVGVVYLLRDFDLLVLAWTVTASAIFRTMIYFFLVGKLLSIQIQEFYNSIISGFLKGLVAFVLLSSVTWLSNSFHLLLVWKVIIQTLVGTVVLTYFLVIKPSPTFGRIWKDSLLKYPNLRTRFDTFLRLCNWYDR